MIYIGIDPGLTGALATINDFSNPLVKIYDTPTIEIKEKKQYMPGAMAQLLHPFSNTNEVMAVLENVHSMPKQGVASSFGFGVGKGIWIGILSAYNILFDSPSPQKWKKALGLTSDKGEAIAKALELYPQVAAYLTRKKDDGRAEALLLAHYGRLVNEGSL